MIMKTIHFFGKTDMGRKRTNNEDAFIAQNIWDEKHILAVAIDGVGGYEGGEVAAELAQKNIVKYLETYPNGERLDLLKQAVIFANNAIFDERKRSANLCNMSCVLTAALIEVENRRINMAHVGDTRIYQYVDGVLTKLSHDHSLIGYREEIGELSEEEAMNHPQRNIIGRDVGSTRLESNANDYVEVASFPLEAHSSLMLCSDGLCDMITSQQMKSILEKNLPTEKKVDALIDAANQAGGKDNVTVVLVECNLPELPRKKIIETETHPTEIRKKSTEETKKELSLGRNLIIIGIALLCFIGGYIFGGYSGHKILPGTQHADDIDSIRQRDSIIIELKEDRYMLLKQNIELESCIDSLQNTNNNQ
ncbi:MAG: serine/threonine-protein phosphatase [Bacteroidales bacterium]|nr:serine/threonine-protein phosphatase [Bacteroidales bacterium]